MRFLPQTIWTGISLSFLSGILVMMIAGTVKNEPDPNKINQKAIFAMVALGVGELIGGQIIGQVVDRWGSKKACLVKVLLIGHLDCSNHGFSN